MKIWASLPTLKFWVFDGIHEVTVQKDVCALAKSRGVTKEQIVKQFTRVHDTPFAVKNIEVVLDENVFIPVSLMNMVRREGIALLEERRIHGYED